MKTNRRQCKNAPDNFCYICGQFATRTQRKKMTNKVHVAYQQYFGIHIGDFGKIWAPQFCCNVCYVGLTKWQNGKKKSMPFAIPMIWREPIDHSSDCYFCMTNISGYSSRNKKKIVYPICQSAMRPVPHDQDNPVPKPFQLTAIADSNEEDEYEGNEDADKYEFSTADSIPHMITKLELNDLVRDLNLSINKSELLASRLKQWNLLKSDTSITHFRSRHSEIARYYNKEDNICFCSNVNDLMKHLDHDYKPEEWRLFIDAGKGSLKAVLLHNGNVKPSVPIAYGSGLPETYDSMKGIFKLIKYSAHQWFICADLKVISLILGLQLGYTKHMCFLCLWNSRDDVNHYNTKYWPGRIDHIVGKYNISQNSLVDKNKIILPPLHIKLGLFKNFVKALPRNSMGLAYLKDKFGRIISVAKIEAGVFTGPQIRSLICDNNFRTKLQSTELRAFEAFVDVVQNFLGNYKSGNYVEVVENLLKSYKDMRCRMSLKIHFLHSHLNFFHSNLGDVSDEQGERFHQEISIIEHRYQGRFGCNMMGDYCWSLKRDCNTSYSRRASARSYFTI